MRDLILTFGEQLARGAALAKPVDVPYRRIISCGMGGSSVAGECLSMVKEDVIVHWDYELPPGAGAQDLVICTSWSGNTEEVLSSYDRALSLGAPIVTITTGGKLAERAKHNGTPLVLLPHETDAPRVGAGYMIGAILGAVGLAHLVPKIDAAEHEGEGKRLADGLGDRMLVVYSSYPWRKLTGFWKMIYSETTKRQVMANWFPSGAHVEIVGWEGPYADKVNFLFIHDPDDLPHYTQNFDALLAVLGEKEYDIRSVRLSGATVLEKACTAYVTALWTALHAAQSLGVDPEATVLLDAFKAEKEERAEEQ